MDVNKIKILNTDPNKEITFPLGTNWDLYDREGAIIQEESSIIEEVIGEPLNYELIRFSRKPIGVATNQTYEFNFFSGTTNNWLNTFLTKFNDNQVRYSANAFKKSFFKLDLYDSPDPIKQKIYLTIILNPQQGLPEISNVPTCGLYRFGSGTGQFTYIDCCGVQNIVNMGPTQPLIEFCPTEPQVATLTTNFGLGNVSLDIFIDGTTFPPPSNSPFPIVYPFYITPLGQECLCGGNSSLTLTESYLLKPKIVLDHVGDQKGYYIYWYQDQTLISLDSLYMRAKFFDANVGTYVTFTNEPQSNYPGSENNLPNEIFYYKLNFNYFLNQYSFTTVNGVIELGELKWYEYVNPPA